MRGRGRGYTTRVWRECECVCQEKVKGQGVAGEGGGEGGTYDRNKTSLRNTVAM